MAVRDIIMRFHLIIRKLRNGAATLDEIQDYLDIQSEVEGSNFRVSQRTFQRDINDIRSIYNFDIQYNLMQGGYYIQDPETPLSDHIMEAFDTFNALNLSDRLSHYIHFDKRKPRGTENLYEILSAIKKKVQIEFTYHKYWQDEFTERVADPYALKEFRSRWYVLARDHNGGKIKSFALDRLSNLEVPGNNIVGEPDFDVDEHYKYCFGIVGPTGARGKETEEVILSFTRFQGNYIKSLPLHHTQEVMVDTDEEFRIKLKVFITQDFIMELLSYTENLEILAPESLINEIKGHLESGVKKYGEKRP